MRLTNLERFASEKGIMVILPEALHGFYSDYAVRDISEADPNLPLVAAFTEMRYQSYIVPELYNYVTSILPASTEKKQTAIGGVGMGGFGALKLGLNNPDLFGTIFSICGYTDLQWMMDHCPDRKEQFDAIFGGNTVEKGSENDFAALIAELGIEEESPRIIQTL